MEIRLPLLIYHLPHALFLLKQSLLPRFQALTEIRESYDVIALSGEGAKFPDELVDTLRPDIVSLSQGLIRLNERVLQSLALALNCDRDFLTACHTQLLAGRENGSKFRTLYYPAITGDYCPHPECGLDLKVLSDRKQF